MPPVGLVLALGTAPAVELPAHTVDQIGRAEAESVAPSPAAGLAVLGLGADLHAHQCLTLPEPTGRRADLPETSQQRPPCRADPRAGSISVSTLSSGCATPGWLRRGSRPLANRCAHSPWGPNLPTRSATGRAATSAKLRRPNRRSTSMKSLAVLDAPTPTSAGCAPGALARQRRESLGQGRYRQRAQEGCAGSRGPPPAPASTVSGPTLPSPQDRRQTSRRRCRR